MLPQPCNLYIWIFYDENGTDGWKFSFRITFSCKLCTVLALRGERKVAIEMCSTNCQPSAIRRFPRSCFHLPRSRKTTVGKVDFQLLQISMVSLMMIYTSKRSGLYNSQRHILVFCLSYSSLCCFKTMPALAVVVSGAASLQTRCKLMERFYKYVCGKYH